jgi:hypothetical protein
MPGRAERVAGLRQLILRSGGEDHMRALLGQGHGGPEADTG